MPVSRPAISRLAVSRVICLIGLGWTLSGCVEPRPPLRVSSPDVEIKVLAIGKAVREKDLSVVGQLIKDLDSDDPAVRFFAINGLRRLTGQQFGYEYYLDRAARQESLLKWQEWHARWQADQAASGGTTGGKADKGATGDGGG